MLRLLEHILGLKLTLTVYRVCADPMPVEHETSSISETLSPVQIIAIALQRAAQSRATCPPDEIRSGVGNRLPPALAAEEEGTDVIADQPHEVTIEPLSLHERPLSVASVSPPRAGHVSLNAAQEEQPSDAPDFGAAYGEVRNAPEPAPRSTSSLLAAPTFAPSPPYIQPVIKVCRICDLDSGGSK